MMRIFKFVVVALLVFIILFFLGSFVFLKTVDLNRFKEQITKQISDLIGRDVTMNHISLGFSVREGLMLHISGLSVMDLPDFSREAMFYVDSSHLNADILSFILKRQILVSKIEFNSLKINLIRNNAGEINFQKFTKQVKSRPTNIGGSVLTAGETSSVKESKSERRDFDFGKILVRSIRVTDGTFVFTDRMMVPPVTVPVTQLEFQVSNLSFDAPFLFRAEASLWSEHRNLRLNGSAQVNTQNRQIRIDDLKMRTDLSGLLLDRMYKGIPLLEGVGLKNGIEGGLAIDVYQMILGEKGLLVLSSEGRIIGGKVQFKEFPVPLENVNAYFEMTESDIEVKKIEMPFSSGGIKISGRIIEYSAEQKFLASLNLANVQLGELGEQMGLPVKLEGELHADFQINGRGMNKKALKSFMSGKGMLEIKNGRIRDVNILKLVLSKILVVPGLVNQIEENLPDKYKRKLKARDTFIEKAEIDTKIHNGTLFINKIRVDADGFLILANGKLDFDRNLNLEADLYMPSDLSVNIIGISQELSYLLDEDKRIHIPFTTYSGKLMRFQMYPDVKKLGNEIIRDRAKEELRKVILKVLDLDGQHVDENPLKERSPVIQPSIGGEDDEAQEPEPSSEEAIIESILDMIPIF